MGFVIFCLFTMFALGILVGLIVLEMCGTEKWYVTKRSGDVHLKLIDKKPWDLEHESEEYEVFKFYLSALFYYFIVKNKDRFEK